MSKPRRKKRSPKRVLALPDLEQSKTAVLNTLTSNSGQRTYAHAISDFVAWYWSEPRLAFNRTVVLRYRIFLEQKQYAPTTINLRLAAVRRLAFEAADSGLLSPELAAKGVRRIGVRVGNWLTSDQSKRLLATADRNSLRGKRNYAILAMLIGCGLRRGELLALRVDTIELREGRWVVANLMGKAGHVRTVPIPAWVKSAIALGPKGLRMPSGSMPTGGLAVFRIRLLPMSGPSRTAVLQVNCALGNVPRERSVEGIRLSLEKNGTEFSEEVRGRVMFLSMRPEVSGPAKALQESTPEVSEKPQKGLRQ